MPIMHFDTDHLRPAERTERVREEIGRRFIGVKIDRMARHPLRLDLSVAMGATIVMSKAHVEGMAVDRDRQSLSDGDDDVTCWINAGVAARTDYDGDRRLLGARQAMLIGHGRPARSWWLGSHLTLLRFPRHAFPDIAAVERACGRPHAAGRPVLKLLRAYLRGVWQGAAGTGAVEPEAERNIIAMVGALAAASPEGMRRAAWPALGPARVAAMREVIARRAAEPGLRMRDVAAAVGLSERSAHLVLAQAGHTFTGILTEVRLQRVAAQLSRGGAGRIIDAALDAGFGDVAHFNRLFRRRFGMTPGDMLRAGAPPDLPDP